ncbi:putative PAB-dependent poly(A)-specific ribonuclease subunit PAN3-like [Apostichopus japonicus]|uniref:Putative PAB-dependent poly(A)-specific ribonuclease subunit PAN3-like n=1 Tax=Stichopus japonicus TaxID=307972 RepID=A0A2G8K8H7_STIJA|nr:putative PAB-dependent poly(A)-specific ribonuclease subunit PAN3-like [Apostichopus japonicus]
MADPHMAPEHFFTAPFDSDSFGPPTSKLQTLMQRSQSVGTGLANYAPQPGQPPPDAHMYSMPSMDSSGMVANQVLPGSFAAMSIADTRNIIARSYVISALKASNRIFNWIRIDKLQAAQAPSPVLLRVCTRLAQHQLRWPIHQRAEILPSARNVRDANVLTPSVPEFVPRRVSVTVTTTAGKLATSESYLAGSLSAGASPKHSPGSSPILRRRDLASIPAPLDLASPSQQQQQQFKQPRLENIGGTTYFITDDQLVPGAHPAQDELDLIQRHLQALAHIDATKYPDLPSEVDNYTSLYPLEPAVKNPMDKTSTFGFTSACYKAVNKKDGKLYCLRRIHGFKVSNTQWMVLVDKWKKLQHSNIVSLREVFSTKAFGEHSIIFVHDYHAGAMTLMNRHFSGGAAGQAGQADGFHGSLAHFGKGPKGTFRSHHGGMNGPIMPSRLLPEGVIWTYVIQLSAALRTIHSSELACRVMDPTKILLKGKSRILVNCVGIFDVLTYDSNQSSPMTMIPHYQQEDLISLGKVILALACNSVQAIQRQHIQSSMELVAQHYSSDLKNLIIFNGDVSWSETGDRYLLKLFRDYLFHQVTPEGAPWVDLAHIVQSLNKLDAGVDEKVCLASRDEQNVLIVTYTDLKRIFMSTFGEITQAAQLANEQMAGQG